MSDWEVRRLLADACRKSLAILGEKKLVNQAEHDAIKALREAIEANRSQRKFIVIGLNVWGKGDTEAEALAKAKLENGGPLKTYAVYNVHPETTVDGMGSMGWPHELDSPDGQANPKDMPVEVRRVVAGKPQKAVKA